MPQRSFSSGSYRYGFNGKENDNEIKGQGNQQDYGERVYDTRLGRFLSTDPLTKSYPMLTPYQYASNSPIWMIDLDGLEGVKFSSVWNGRANIVQFVNDPDVGGTIMETTETINRNFNFVFNLVNYGYKFGTGQDYDGNAIDSRGKSGVAADMGVEAMQWLTLGRFFKSLPNASTPLEQQMAQNARANGTPPSKPAQVGAMTKDAKTQVSTTTKPMMQPVPVQQQQAGIVTSGTTALVKYDAQFAVSQALENGKFNFDKIRSMIPNGTANTFQPSSGGEKYIFNINNTKIQLKWHTPEFSGNSPVGSNASLFNTAQIKVGNKYLQQFGGFIRNNKTDQTHIPLKTP